MINEKRKEKKASHMTTRVTKALGRLDKYIVIYQACLVVTLFSYYCKSWLSLWTI